MFFQFVVRVCFDGCTREVYSSSDDTGGDLWETSPQSEEPLNGGRGVSSLSNAS